MRHDDLIADGDLCLAPLEVTHVGPRYVGWLNDPATVDQTEQSGRTHSLESVTAYVEETLRAPDALIWRIVAAGAHVGNLRLSGIHRLHRRASIALIIGEPETRGRGLGTRAIRLAADHALHRLGLNKVTAGLYATNTASRRAFEKAGFQLEATLRRHAWHEQGFVDVLQMARFADDA